MAMHSNKSLIKYGAIFFVVVLLLVIFKAILTPHTSAKSSSLWQQDGVEKNTDKAANDSASESLNTLTAELSEVKQQMTKLNKDNQQLQSKNAELENSGSASADNKTSSLQNEVEELKSEIQGKNYKINDNNAGANTNMSQPITTVPDLTQPVSHRFDMFNAPNNQNNINNNNNNNKNKKPVKPFYTIPPNATAVHDRLMTALVGRIPVKGVVTDPYPFKIVFSDDTLAANGLRIPNLRQLIVSGYTEGDLNLLSVRGWVTSLTFVFQDGTISTTTSNDNNIGQFTKNNALGYLSDEQGNPFIRGKLISNAPSYLTGNILLGAAQGAAGAFAQAQTTNQSTVFGTSSSTVTGSANKYVMGQAGVQAAGEAQQWWHDREEQSFDAIYVPTLDAENKPVYIYVNFAKEIQIDYDPQGRKIVYAHQMPANTTTALD